MRSHMLVAATIALATVSACGTAEQPETAGGGKVATLQSATASAAPAASKAAQRPRERLDTTREEFEAMLAPYHKCMRANGAGFRKGTSGDAGVKPASPEQEAIAEKANKICEPQFYPLPPWERDPANPESRDFAVAVVKCLKGEGVEYVVVAEDGISISLGGEDNDQRSIRLGMDKIPECERQVAAKKK